jgi:hypothetical protein
MASYRVVEHVTGKNGNNKEYTVMAIEFLEPSYVKIRSNYLPKVGSTIEVNGTSATQDGRILGTVIETRRAEDVRVNLHFDVKYTGGYSMDGKTIYLDENFPKFFTVEAKKVSTVESIGLHHELPEKWMSDNGYEYPYAHEIATGIEKKYVESLGVTWKGYCEEVDKNLRKVYSKTLQKSPPSLDLSPYLYCRDREALKEIRQSEE